MSELIKLVQWLLNVTPLLTAQLLLILVMREVVQQKFGARVTYQLWLLPSAWLICTSILNTVSNQLFQNTINIRALHVPPVSELLTSSSVVIQPVLATSVGPEAFWQLLFWIWLTGLAATFAVFVTGASRFQEYFNREGKRCSSKKIRELVLAAGFPETLPVVILGRHSSPALYGVVEYCLLLPEDFVTRFNEEQCKAVLAHEYVHYARKDNALNFMAQLLRMLFWFNPVAYFAYRGYRIDQELACDACVLKESNHQQRRYYAEALLCSASGRNYEALGLSSWGSKRLLKQRTRMLNTCHVPAVSCKARIMLMAALLLVGTLGSSAIRSNESQAQQFLNAEIIPASLLNTIAMMADANTKLEPPQTVDLRYRDSLVPSDSEYLVFVVDASESLIDSPNWHSIIERLQGIATQYSDLKGIQVINDRGSYLNDKGARQWITYSTEVFRELQAAMSNWRPSSNNSPVEGIREVLTHLIEPGQKVSLYVIGDNLGQPIEGAASEIEQILAASSIQASDVRIHTLMVPTFIFGGTSRENQDNAYKYLSLMYGVSQSNGGTFEIYGIY